MPRQPRIEYPGAIYHVMARGDRREAIFVDDKDREMFLRTMGEAVERSGWRVYGWVLMDNHYHWAIETPEGNLVAGMKWFQNTYTRRFNTRHGAWGHLFGDRYKAIPVEGNAGVARRSGSDYLAVLLDYIHLNPARAGLIGRGKKATLSDYRWSSLHGEYTLPAGKRKPWMAVKEGLELFGFADQASGRFQFIRRLDERAETEHGRAGLATSPDQPGPNPIARGWYLGGEDFREKLLTLVAKRTKTNRTYKSSAAGREHERLSAEEWVKKGAAHFGITLPAKDGEHRAERVAIAWALHVKTNQPQGWIAETLGLRTAANVSQQVRRFSKTITETTKAKEKSPIMEWIKLVKNC